jgi:hypothetical protein
MTLYHICCVRSTARHAIHMQFAISANALEIGLVQSLNILCGVRGKRMADLPFFHGCRKRRLKDK